MAAAVRSGRPDLIRATQAMMQGADPTERYQIINAGNGRVLRVDKMTGSAEDITPPGDEGPGQAGDQLIGPADADRRRALNIPDDGRTWRIGLDSQGRQKLEPIANPEVREDKTFAQEQALAKDVESNPEYKKYQAGAQGLRQLQGLVLGGQPGGRPGRRLPVHEVDGSLLDRLSRRAGHSGQCRRHSGGAAGDV